MFPNSATPSTFSDKLQFLGEGPAAWIVFVGALMALIWVWGGVLRYLSAEV